MRTCHQREELQHGRRNISPRYHLEPVERPATNAILSLHPSRRGQSATLYSEALDHGSTIHVSPQRSGHIARSQSLYI